MPEKRLRAVVRVTMDVEAGSVWGSDTSWEQIEKQAIDGVRGLLMNGNVLALKDLPRKIRGLEMVEVRVMPETKGGA